MSDKSKFEIAPRVHLTLAIIGTMIVYTFQDANTTLSIMVLLLIFIALSVA
jgi:hypothetical protein